MRFGSVVFTNVRLQFRHGFYAAYLVVCLVYVVLIRLAEGSSREALAVALIFTDPAILGLYFIGGMALLERDEGVLESLWVTPLQPSGYSLAKALSLTVLSILAAIALAIGGTFRLDLSWVWFVTGIGLSSTLATFIGLAVVSRCESIVPYAMVATVPAIGMIVPLLDHFGVVTSHWFFLIPTHASITLIGYSFDSSRAAGWEVLLSVGLLVLWNIGAWIWARRWFGGQGTPGECLPNERARGVA